jgi:hypothetical protein
MRFGDIGRCVLKEITHLEEITQLEDKYSLCFNIKVMF